MRTFVISLVLYASCSRLDDILKLRVTQVDREVDHVRFHIPRSKTDQVCDGDYKFMALARNRNLCPVETFKQWHSHQQVGKGAEAALFPSNQRPLISVSKTMYKEP